MQQQTDQPPLRVVGIGGTLRAGSSAEQALLAALAVAERAGASTEMFCGGAIDLPAYNPAKHERTPEALALIEACRTADALVIASPGYHGGVSGVVKNALDYIEDLRTDRRCYLDGRPVGTIATAAGWQAAVGTLGQLRQIVHALRGWPTPVGVAMNTTVDGYAASHQASLELMAGQLVDFARQAQARPASQAAA